MIRSSHPYWTFLVQVQPCRLHGLESAVGARSSISNKGTIATISILVEHPKAFHIQTTQTDNMSLPKWISYSVLLWAHVRGTPICGAMMGRLRKALPSGIYGIYGIFTSRNRISSTNMAMVEEKGLNRLNLNSKKPSIFIH